MKLFRLAPLLVGLALAAACENPAEPDPAPRSGSLKLQPDSVHFNMIGTHTRLAAAVRDSAGKAVAARVEWSYFGDPSASIQSDGSVSARQNGKGKVVASATLPDGTLVADTVPVVVRQLAAGVAIIPGRLGFSPGDTVRLTAIAYDSLRWPIWDATFTWRSADAGVVSVSASGTATGRALGVTSVTATASTPGGAATTAGSAEMGVTSGGSYTQVSSGGSHTCGLVRSGEVYCWGDASGGMLSDGTRLAGDVPTRVRGTEKFVSMEAGHFHTCGITAAGAVFCWGGNLFGQLGTGDTMDRRDTPQPVGGGLAFTRLAVGAKHTCGLVSSGDAYCWGSNDSGELGSGTPMPGMMSKLPTPVGGGHKFVEITAGNGHTCGLTREGTAYCWGSNGAFKLGTSDPLFGGTTTPLLLSGGFTLKAIHAGGHTCAITAQNQVYCWGGWVDINGGDVKARSAPTRVGAGIDFASLADGNDAMCGVARDGAGYCWTPTDTPPTRVGGSVGFTSLSPGRDRSCAVGTDGRIYCWGPGGVGGMGDGRTRSSDVPVPVSAAF